MLCLYDTQTRAPRAFEPQSMPVTMWCCGPTVYDVPHIGNARPAIVFDVLFRLLRRRYGGDTVRYARNFTDIDDKIMARASDSGQTVDGLTASTIVDYEAVMDRLAVLPPTAAPRATQSIPAIQSLIQRLLDRNHAYVAENHVVFDVSSNPHPGKLSGMPLDKLREGARVDVAPYKRDPADFVLWKPSSDEQPGWASPWGRGRPGWHIECSAMIGETLGTTIDIHCGGADLLFPHHENEVAQSECAHGAPLARYWLHNGMLLVDGTKMAKSTGNFVTVPDVLDRYHPEVLRYLLLTTQYRQPLDFTWARLESAKASLDSLYRAKQSLEGHPNLQEPGRVEAALLDDLNTPMALTALHEALSGPAEALGREMAAASELLGILRLSAEDWFHGDPAEAAEIDRLIAERDHFRAVRDWAQSDRVRDDLNARGILVEDGPQGTSWRRQ